MARDLFPFSGFVERPTAEENRLLRQYADSVVASQDGDLQSPVLPLETVGPFQRYRELSSAKKSGPADKTVKFCENFHMNGFIHEHKSPTSYDDYATNHAGVSKWERFGGHWLYTSSDNSLLRVIQKKCEIAELKICRLERCRAIREKIGRVLPRCEYWQPFRAWVLVAISCQLSSAAAGYKWLHTFDAFSFQQLIYGNIIRGAKNTEGRTEDWRTVFKVCEIIFFWLSEVEAPLQPPEASRMDLHAKIKTRLCEAGYEARIMWDIWKGDEPRVRHLLVPAIEETEREAAELQMCPSRLWNVARIADRAANDLHCIVQLAKSTGHTAALANKGRGECCPEFCQQSDENSTTKEQLHKCSGKACDVVSLPISDLCGAVERGLPTAWNTPIGPDGRIQQHGFRLIQSSSPGPNERYIAISHVWSDGTGVGVRGPGQVHECLLSYFAQISHELGCHGIWWDTICIPNDKKTRRVVISNMNRYYEEAEWTVVHDEYLVQFPWAEDGSAALALIFSPWFSRGWTALELSVSTRVKVIYRHPTDARKYVLKDLDDDVLSQGVVALGQRVVSKIIQRLRTVPTLPDLLKILSMRTTSWARDRICIAGLLARADGFDYNDSQAETTRKIVRTYGSVPKGILFHGHAALAASGGFSWCPFNLLSSESIVTSHQDEDFEPVHVDDDGAVVAQWYFHTLSKRRADSLIPQASHISVRNRIRQAIEKRECCLLLYAESPVSRLAGATSEWKPRGRAVLVTTAGIRSIRGRHPSSPKYAIDCHYIGSVLDDSLPGGASEKMVYTRIGSNSYNFLEPARKVVKSYFQAVEEISKGDDSYSSTRI